MLELTPIELKLLRLGLNSGAREGEIQGASRKFFDSLRRRGVSAQSFETALNGASNGSLEVAQQSRPDYGKCIMPFRRSKYYGQMFMDIPPGALRSTLRWIESTEELRQKFGELAFNITEFFKQSQS
jgi:hypothetical protein